MITILYNTALSSGFEALPLNWAYLDPGTGSMVLQVLLAGLLSSLFFLKSWIRQFRDGVWVKKRSA
jgi:hypothetical protein